MDVDFVKVLRKRSLGWALKGSPDGGGGAALSLTGVYRGWDGMRAGLPHPSFISRPIITLPVMPNTFLQLLSIWKSNMELQQRSDGYSGHLAYFKKFTFKSFHGGLCIFSGHEGHEGSVWNSAALLLCSGPHDLYTGQGAVFTKLSAEQLFIHLEQEYCIDHIIRPSKAFNSNDLYKQTPCITFDLSLGARVMEVYATLSLVMMHICLKFG